MLKIILLGLLLIFVISGCQSSQIGLDSIVAKQVAETLTAVSMKPEPTGTHVSTANSIPTQNPAKEQQQAKVPFNWEIFETDDISIWLPDTYIGGNVKKDIGLITKRLKTLGPEFEQIVLIIEQYPDLFVLFATDSETGPSGFLTNVNVIREEVISTLSLQQYIELTVKGYPSQYHIVENKITMIGDLKAGRLVTEFVINGISGKQVQYMIRGDNEMWIITYSTGLSEFDQRLPEFEESINSFRIKSE